MRQVLTFFLLFISTQSGASMIYNQVDQINVPIDAYTNVGDLYSLTVTGPVTSTVAIRLASNAGCNLCNAIVQWGTAINNDPILSNFLTATYSVWDGVSVIPFGSGGTIANYDASIFLTAKTAGVEFFSTVSATSLTGISKTNPNFSNLSVSVRTIVSAHVPVSEPPLMMLFSLGFMGIYLTRKRINV